LNVKEYSHSNIVISHRVVTKNYTFKD